MSCPTDYDPSEFYEGEPDEGEVDEDVERAKPCIEDIITQVKVATDRELKVRLEKKFFPWIIGRALNTMKREGIVRRVGYAGRRSAGKRIPESFLTLYGMSYNKIVGILEEKRAVSRDINAILTAHAPAGTHAEDLFKKAFLELGFKIHKRDASEFKGRKVTVRVEGKKLPDLDFIFDKNSVVYGVDIKNWIKYEYSTRFQVMRKVSLALDLDIVPFIIARYVDRDTIYKEIYLKGGIC
ncbi:hypothetical protein MUO74_01220, partial [Candidatus Bathyarchaeota archaeon]|nr:hypothetical protein [Candidatus Bathyarchaeota archaeon]